MSGQSVTVTPEVLADDRWEPVRCERGRRVIDVNYRRQEVRYACSKCRTTHTVDVQPRGPSWPTQAVVPRDPA